MVIHLSPPDGQYSSALYGGRILVLVPGGIMADLTSSSVPLSSFSHIRTSNVTVLEEIVGRHYAGAKIEQIRSAEGLNVVANRCQLKNIGLTYGRHQARLRIRIPELQVYALLFSFKGSAGALTGRTNIEIAGQHAFVGSPAESLCLDYAPEFEQLILSISADALTKKLEALNGEPPTNRLAFEHTCDFRRAESENLRRMFMFLVEQVDSRTSGFHPLALAEFEQAMIVTFLSALHHNYSHLLLRRGRSVSPWQVRRAEEYIESNWDQPLTVEALALVTGVSTRSLFLSFQRSRGYSPMDFVKRVRLAHARKMLGQPEEATSVTNVAFDCGFGNLGHFANYYRQRFGEAPSATLQRSRRTSRDCKS